LGLTNRVKWRRVQAAPDASAARYCSRRNSRALRGSVASALALRRSAVRALWRDVRAVPPAHHGYAYARESRGYACGGFSRADKSVSSWSVRLLKRRAITTFNSRSCQPFLARRNCLASASILWITVLKKDKIWVRKHALVRVQIPTPTRRR
jgi:hypothetical protein